MPVPSRERVIELISELVHAQGYDVDDVVVTSAGKHSAVRIMVDSDAGIELDAAAEISRLVRSEEHTSEHQSLIRNSYAVFCLNKTKHVDTDDDRTALSSRNQPTKFLPPY